MGKTIEFGIGFVTGRPNVCKLINSYYKDILEQVKGLKEEVRFTFFILYDLEYQFTKRTDFYGILPEVYKNIKIKYITPEDIEEEKKKLISRHEFKKEEVDLLLGHGHAKGRNTVMYYAYKAKIDYLLFWDDDEYPVAIIRDEDRSITWKKQNNILQHINNIKSADITIGYHCGYISPIPYLDIGNEISEEEFKDFIEGIGNEVVSWESIKNKMQKGNGITYADDDIANGKNPYELKDVGIQNAVVGSTLCINMRNIANIPAFYNPEGARGEDAFFSASLGEAKVVKVPLYHFHDGFLKYTTIMKGKYPKTLRKIVPEENSVEQRFMQASRGWIKYKPLWLYISDSKTYKEKIKLTREQLSHSIPRLNKLFDTVNFNELINALEEYDKNVKKHYSEFIITNEVWNKIKKCI